MLRGGAGVSVKQPSIPDLIAESLEKGMSFYDIVNPLRVSIGKKPLTPPTAPEQAKKERKEASVAQLVDLSTGKVKSSQRIVDMIFDLLGQKMAVEEVAKVLRTRFNKAPLPEPMGEKHRRWWCQERLENDGLDACLEDPECQFEGACKEDLSLSIRKPPPHMMLHCAAHLQEKYCPTDAGCEWKDGKCIVHEMENVEIPCEAFNEFEDYCKEMEGCSYHDGKCAEVPRVKAPSAAKLDKCAGLEEDECNKDPLSCKYHDDRCITLAEYAAALRKQISEPQAVRLASLEPQGGKCANLPPGKCNRHRDCTWDKEDLECYDKEVPQPYVSLPPMLSGKVGFDEGLPRLGSSLQGCGSLEEEACKAAGERCDWEPDDQQCYDKVSLSALGMAPAVQWPDRNKPGFEEFMVELYDAFQKQGLDMQRDERWCPNDSDADLRAKAQTMVERPAIEQRLIPYLLSPQTPYHGALLYHMVGSGKTRTALATLSNYRNTDTRLIWVTTIRAKVSLQAQYNDFPSYDPEYKGTKQSPFFSGPGAKTHPLNMIALFTYEEFVNALKMNKNNYGRFVLTQRKEQHGGDPFYNSFVVIDEAHKIFEKKNGAGSGTSKLAAQYLVEKAAYDSYEKSGDKACKWLLLTATPMPSIEVPTDARRKAKTAGGPQAAFRLLNMLIDDPARRLPVDESSFKYLSAANKTAIRKQIPRSDFEALTGADYADLAKGLVSYFNPSWENIFAKDIGGAQSVTTVKLTDDPTKYEGEEAKIKIKLKDKCKLAMKSKDAEVLGRCFLRRLHWLGNNLGPRASKNATGLPGKLQKKDFANLEDIPRAFQLLETIKEADEKDRAKYGHKFKHVIYTSSMQNTDAMYASLLALDAGFEFETPKERLKELGLDLKMRCPKTVCGKPNWMCEPHDMTRPSSCPEREKEKYVEGTMTPDGKDVLFFMHDKLTKSAFEDMQTTFNDHERNNHGQIARIIVLGPGRKEALSLHDVKYVHIMEPQMTDTDTKQIIGRARRYCSHVGLTPKEREIEVFIYHLFLPEHMLHLRSGKERSALALIAQNAIKSGDVVAKELAARSKILSWMEASAFDIIIEGNTPAEIRQIISEAREKLKTADVAVREQLAKVRYASKLEEEIQAQAAKAAAKLEAKEKKKAAAAKPKGMSVKDLKALCKQNNVKGYSNINAKNKAEWMEKCGAPKELPPALEEQALPQQVPPRVPSAQQQVLPHALPQRSLSRERAPSVVQQQPPQQLQSQPRQQSRKLSVPEMRNLCENKAETVKRLPPHQRKAFLLMCLAQERAAAGAT